LKGGVLISDVALRQQETATLRLAREAGLQTQDGRPMVLEQGIEAFWLVNRPLLSKHGITKEQVSEVMRSVAAH